MNCNIFKKPLSTDINNISGVNFDLQWLNNLIPAYDANKSGIWNPVWVSLSNSKTSGVQPLYPARSAATKSFSPCDCQDAQINPKSLYQEESIIGLCNYCGSPPTGVKWKLYDDTGASSPREYLTTCCSGGCDVMLKVDDYVPKIPYLNHAYITGLVDWKHKKQFPASNNKPLGCDSFISADDSKLSTIKGVSLKVDWRIQETISEVPYDKFSSYHDSQYMHEKTYKQSQLTSSTCGNFIMVSLPSSADTGNFYSREYPIFQNLIFSSISGDTPDSDIPTPGEFANIPYGFDQETYKNIFIHKEKIGSYWKWNYTSGILCWYRHYNVGMSGDTRPLPGIDLYISPGDVFFAENDGPEPATDLTNPTGMVGSVKSCPSGLKLLKGSVVTGIVPSGSQFAYISQNIYDKFYTTYKKLLEILPTGDDIAKRSFKAAMELATAPQYDEIIVDLFKRHNSYNYTINNYGQIDLLNKYMQSGTTFDSVSRLNYISDKEELLNTLVSKYGAYLWAPPNAETQITFASSIDTTFAVGLSFNLSIIDGTNNWSNTNCVSFTNCASRSLTKNFSYEQKIGYGQGNISTKTNEDLRHLNTCISGSLSGSNYGFYSNIYFNSSLIKSIFSSSGCSVLYDIYPRISESSTSTFCTDCDPYSSFYLINNAEIVECGNFNSTNSFCYSTLARRFNNSPKQFPTDEQNRVERALADGTKRWKRSYNGLFFNPHIDSVAFHQNNGVFINSTPFKLDSFIAFESTSSATSSDKIYVKFTTKDLGIKIYELGAEYLQTSNQSSYGCKRFPVNQTCQCLPIISPDVIQRPIKCDSTQTSFSNSNIFTPGLSTRYAPTLKKYGGFNQTYLDSIFGAGKLTAGGTVPTLTSFRSPATPLGCNSTVSVTLYNYTNSEWNISLQGKSPEADISATINENINLLGPRYIFTIYRDEGREDQVTNFFTDYDPILSSKRFATKVTINDTEAYNGQTVTLSSPGSTLSIKLKNPFLAAAMAAAGGDENAILYPPSGNLQREYVFENNKTTSVGDTNRGDETSAVTITFSQKFKSHKLLYKISPLTSMGTLTNGFFDPNKGLTTSITNQSPISGGILYTHELTGGDWPQGKVYYGDITPRVANAIRSLNDFETNKKLRLYIQQDNKWYKYVAPTSGSFLNNNLKYPGTPTFFEYNAETGTNNLPGLLLTSVRQHVDFDFIRNNSWTDNLPRYDSKTPFPLSRNICTRSSSNDTELIIPGIRSYFLIPEKDPAIITNLESMNDIGSFSAPSDMKYGSTIVFNNKQHWICIDPKQPKLRASYVYSEYSYLNQYFSDTHIKYKINLQGYVYNTKKSGEHPIKLYFGRNFTSSDNTILEKSIYVTFKTKNGDKVTNFSTQDVYIQPYTLLKLKNVIPSETKAFDLYPNPGTSLILGQVNAPVSEHDPLLINEYLPGKWGDVVGYDGRLVDASIDAQYQIDKIYPKSTYNNLFQQMIINNHSKNHVYKISGYGSAETSLITGIRDALNEGKIQSVYYCTLHKYGIGDNTQTYSVFTDQYHNYIPLIDLNLINITAENIPISGKINVSNVTKSINPINGYEAYGPSGKFWINFPSGATAEGTFVPMSDFYSETLRIDTPIYWLNTTTQNTKIVDSGVTCRAEFSPRNVSNYNAGSIFDNSVSCSIISSGRQQPFWTYPIYCDRDDNTCDNSGCFGSGDHGLTKKSDLELYANYKIGQQTNVSLSNPMGFAFGYDAGVYNIIGNDSLVEIKRFQLAPNNLIENYTDSCSSAYILPTNYKVGSSSPVFQATINNTSVSTPLSYPMDEAANEILFRILYGQSQYVNRKMYFIDNEIYTKKDIIGYTDPRVKAEDIYTQILYNYDKASSSNFNLNGSFIVNGVAAIGSNTTININDWSTTITIENRPATGIYAVATMNDGSKLESLIYRTTITNLEYVIQDVHGVGDPPVMPDPDPPAPTIIEANASLQFLGECLYYDSYKYWPLAFGYEQGKFPTQPFQMVEQSTSCGISWANAAGEASMGRGGICCCGSFTCGGGCVVGSITSWGPTNLRQFVCGEPQLGRVGFAAPVTRDPVIPCNGLGYAYGMNSGPCTQFDLGYCRKTNCPKCQETLVSETQNNFTYSWQNCRTNFSLYGHIYRQVHFYEYNPIIIQPRPPDCYTTTTSNNGADACGNVPPGAPSPTSSSITTCTTYPVVGLTRSQLDEVMKQNMLIGIVPGTNYSCPSQNNGYAPPVSYASCVPVYGPGSKCAGQDAFEKACLWQGCSPDPLGVPNADGECPPTVSAGKGCKFCYTPESSYTMKNDGIDDGFEYPTGKCDQYCHFCGIGRTGSHNVNFKKKVFLKSWTTNFAPYNPLCATSLCTVSYSNGAITLNINGKSKCFSQTINSCPTITISSSMTQLSVSDSVESNCDECLSSSLKVIVPEQRKAFVTKRERRRCLLSTFASCSINDPGLVTGGAQAYEWHMSWALKCGGGEPEYGCGELGGKVYDNSDLLFDITYECLKGLPCAMTNKLAAYVVPETEWKLNTQLKGRYAYLAKGSNHIPVEDIIEGVVPGSVSTVQKESYKDKKGISITRTGTITNEVATIYAFYYTYDYIRPVTMQDVLRNDSSIMCTSNFFEIKNDNTYHQCSALPFPSQYASNLDIAAAYRFNLGKTGFLEGVSYTNTHPIYYQKSNCDGAITCYYNHKVFICGAGDFCCMGDLGVVKNEGIESTCGEAQIPFTEV